MKPPIMATLRKVEGAPPGNGGARSGGDPSDPETRLNPSTIPDPYVAGDPYAEPPPADDVVWVPVASLNLPIDSGVIEKVVGLLAGDLARRRLPPLVVRESRSQPDVLRLGYHARLAR